VLQQRAVVRNERRNFQDLFLSRDRAEILAKAGRLPEFQADQAKQDELRAKDRWILAVKQYFELLDRFKIELGLPTDTNVDLDDADLDALLQTGINLIPISLEHAVALALENRQDLKTDKDRVADARRKVYVAENNLGPDIDMVFEATVPTEPETKITKFQFNEAFWNAGVDLDLALERLSERNAFRSALIVLDRTQRDYSLKVDEVKRDVREAWRTLQQTRDSYVIRKNSVDLAMRRVDSTTLLLKAGRADTRDLLESQSALVEAENALVRTLTDHTIARLDFLRDTGLLTVTDKLLWQPFDDNI
jgi:outer membrane protein TolC